MKPNNNKIKYNCKGERERNKANFMVRIKTGVIDTNKAIVGHSSTIITTTTGNNDQITITTTNHTNKHTLSLEENLHFFFLMKNRT